MTGTSSRSSREPTQEKADLKRYVMKQKLLSWGDDFTIKDESGTDAFFVDGKALSFGDKLSFQDMSGNELVYIEQKLLNWGPTYELWRGDEQLAVVKRELFSFIHHRFTVDVPGPNDLEAEGIFSTTSTQSLAATTSRPLCPSAGSAGRTPTG